MKEAKVMKLLRFHKSLTLNQAKYYTGIGKGELKRVIGLLMKKGLVKQEQKAYLLTSESDFWLGWHRF